MSNQYRFTFNDLIGFRVYKVVIVRLCLFNIYIWEKKSVQTVTNLVNKLLRLRCDVAYVLMSSVLKEIQSVSGCFVVMVSRNYKNLLKNLGRLMKKRKTIRRKFLTGGTILKPVPRDYEIHLFVLFRLVVLPKVENPFEKFFGFRFQYAQSQILGKESHS